MTSLKTKYSKTGAGSSTELLDGSCDLSMDTIGNLTKGHKHKASYS